MKKILVKDPVCGMEVDSQQCTTEYLQSSYAFCSAQCRDRFLATPHLYIGFPGQKAPKQEGLEVLKQRRLGLDAPLSQSQADRLTNALEAMMGIKSIEVTSDKILITYDLMQATAKQIEIKLGEIGVQLGEGWSEHLRRAFVHYEEELEVGSLEVHMSKHIHGH